jgi:hypothetical protein
MTTAVLKNSLKDDRDAAGIGTMHQGKQTSKK